MRKTKIICTLGPSTDDEKVLRELMLNGSDFAAALLRKEHVAVVPGAPFGAENSVRLSFAISEENIREAMLRIGRFVRGLMAKAS